MVLTRRFFCGIMFHARTAEHPIRPVGQAAKTPPSHGGNGGSIPPRVRKNLASARFFQLYSFLRNELYSTCGRVILLRSDIRPSVELRNKKNAFPQAKISHPATAGYFTKKPTGRPVGFSPFLFSFLSSLFSEKTSPKRGFFLKSVLAGGPDM